jgi:lysine 2,3-aminomutase
MSWRPVAYWSVRDRTTPRGAPPAIVTAPPAATRTPRSLELWPDVPDERWYDWRWQLSHRLSTVAELERCLTLTSSERNALATSGLFRVDLTPYLVSTIHPTDAECPIRRQVLPTEDEALAFEGIREDSLAEEAHTVAPGLVHRYPDRVLMLVTTECASYCRFCTRSRIVGQSSENFGREQHEAQLHYIAAHPEVRDVLLSGGDPLALPDRVLERLLADLRAIEHVEIVRIGTRVPFFLPQRVTPDLVTMLARYHPLWLNVHVNHPDELTPEVAAAFARLADAGIPLGAQTVLMAGINDCPNLMLDLVRRLVRLRVRPYYLYQCDQVRGAGHFRTPVAKGIEIMEALRGHTSGYAVPTYVIDAPEGGGKVPIAPQYLISMSDRRVAVRNYEGFVSSYVQPSSYAAHDPDRCAYCAAAAATAGGHVASLLQGTADTIRPAGWHEDRIRR